MVKNEISFETFPTLVSGIFINDLFLFHFGVYKGSLSTGDHCFELPYYSLSNCVGFSSPDRQLGISIKLEKSHRKKKKSAKRKIRE